MKLIVNSWIVKINNFVSFFQKLVGKRSKPKKSKPPEGAGVTGSEERGFGGSTTTLEETTATDMGNMCPGSGAKPKEASVHMSGNNATISTSAMPISPGDVTFGIQQHNNSSLNMNAVNNPLMGAEDNRPLPKVPVKCKEKKQNYNNEGERFLHELLLYNFNAFVIIHTSRLE